ncbi:GDSL esterase/lipase At1g28580-like [Ipomoea triloba]|uniref:GDSL esterase/lipase At1g28580-like n=1 Tax=Ipomoea triloba TaxID=35885 RepID=UPI00125CD418|nr:GDSL esterase/lipase At1g28580-like [Ipomoea triloba]
MSLPIVACALLLAALASSQFADGCYTSIFAFGDSITDTGNYFSLISKGLLQYDEIPNCSVPPYGETFFHHPTGRCADGRLIIDFIAEHYGLPFLQPYSGGGNAANGVNFAVVGATVLTDDVLQTNTDSADNISLMSQINMFKTYLPSICKNTSSCHEIFEKSLIVFGSIGSNDYASAILVKRVEDAYRLQPLVINALASAIEELIKLGVVNLMVPGMMPVGCLDGCLAVYDGSNKEDYDLITGCLTWLNEFGQKHNELLQKELSRIQEHYPNVFITYADYYNAGLELFLSPSKYGFNNETRLIACCGSGGPYNADNDTKCGFPSSQVCDDPSSSIQWDGAHLTEAANEWIAKGLLSGLYTFPNITASCVSSANGNGVYVN